MLRVTGDGLSFLIYITHNQLRKPQSRFKAEKSSRVIAVVVMLLVHANLFATWWSYELNPYLTLTIRSSM